MTGWVYLGKIFIFPDRFQIDCILIVMMLYLITSLSVFFYKETHEF